MVADTEGLVCRSSMVRAVLQQPHIPGRAMTGLNHSLTGAVISKLLPLPLAIPVAFASHFILDSLPHFGEVFEKRKKLSRTVWTIDVIATACFLGFLIFQAQWAALACALAAMSPDIAWIYRFIIQEKFGTVPPRPENKFNAWHVRIQRYESRKGLLLEMAWLMLMTLLLLRVW